MNQNYIYKWQESSNWLHNKHIFVFKNNLLNIAKLDVFQTKQFLFNDIMNSGTNVKHHTAGFLDICNGISVLGFDIAQLLVDDGLHIKFFKELQHMIEFIQSNEIVLDLSGFNLDNVAEYHLLKHTLINFYNRAYSIDKLGYKTISKTVDPILSCVFNTNEYDENAINKLHLEAQIIAKNIILSRKIADIPSQDCTPRDVIDYIQQNIELSNNSKLEIFDQKQIKDQGLGAFYAVGKGSINKPYFVKMQYFGNEKCSKNYVFAGKGVCFDSGGLWLKGGEAMSSMKYDMAGAASLIGLFNTVQTLKLDINLTILIGLVENMPTDRAMRPGDIVTTYSGRTVEIVNTDAEGRLLLCDLLAYASKECNPYVLVDVATLTGAIAKTLGYDIMGVMTNNYETFARMQAAAKLSKDLIWQLPLSNILEDQIKSEIADFTNTPPNNAAQSISAAYFLSKFCDGINWLHLDIAGTALDKKGKNSMANGKPLCLLLQFLINEIKNL